jgi:ABC-type amino acid transport system permease subunit
MYKLNFNFLNKYGGMLLEGMWTTLALVVCCLAIGFVLGTVMALFKQSKVKPLR